MTQVPRTPSDQLQLEPGRNCWRIERADRAAVIVDAADYYRIVRSAMMKAEKQLLLIGWDFDTRIELDETEPDDGAPTTLGPFLTWLAKVKPELEIYILKWDLGALKLLTRGTTLLRVARWASHRHIHFKLDGAHPSGASHHQKIVVIDDALAFCGGIDMTGARWDTRCHRDDEPGRRRPFTKRRYGPWHDATMAVDGAAAQALGELGRMRWGLASGTRPPEVKREGGDLWPQGLEPGFRDVDVAIARTRGKHTDIAEVREIEALFLDLIAGAKKYIYAETQYFASREIARAVAERLQEPDGPEFLIVNPKTADGWLEESIMGPARAELLKVMEAADRHGRFRIYTPVTTGGQDIYVHAKIMIVDDVILRVGSANMNNRSLGLDSECDLLIDSRLPANQAAAGAIADIRNDLMGEHLGVAPADVAQTLARTGSLLRTVEALRTPGRSLVPFEPPSFRAAGKIIARSEVLDPEAGEGSLIEPIQRPGLLKGLKRFRAAPAA